MIFEMTRDYSIIVPLMISNLISFFVSQQLQREPIYEALALQEGVYLPTGESRDELAGIPVGNVMRTGVDLLSTDADIATAKQRFDKEKVHSWPTGDTIIFAASSGVTISRRRSLRPRPCGILSSPTRITPMFILIIRSATRWSVWALPVWMSYRS